jgi:dynein heavy chain
LVQKTKGSLDLLRSRLGTYVVNQYNRPSTQKPFFKSEVILSIPNVVLHPKLEDIQASLNKMGAMIVDIFKKLSVNWSVFLNEPDEKNDKAETIQNF